MTAVLIRLNSRGRWLYRVFSRSFGACLKGESFGARQPSAGFIGDGRCVISVIKIMLCDDSESEL